MPKTILIVDDSVTIRKVLQSQLTKAGFSLVVAETGPAALEMARKHRPNLILLDHQLPGYDGPEVCRQLSLDPTVRSAVIIASSISDEQFRVYGRYPMVLGRLHKPFTPASLLTQVEKGLALSDSMPGAGVANATPPAASESHAEIAEPADSSTQTLEVVLLEDSFTSDVRSVLEEAISAGAIPREKVHIGTSSTAALARVMIRRTPPDFIFFNVNNTGFSQLLTNMADQPPLSERRTKLVGLVALGQPASPGSFRPSRILNLPCGVSEMIAVLFAGVDAPPAPAQLIELIPCSGCDHFNPSEADACAKCAAMLREPCPSCRQTTPTREEVCVSCGVNVPRYRQAGDDLVLARRLLTECRFDEAFAAAERAMSAGYLLTELSQVAQGAAVRREKIFSIRALAQEHLQARDYPRAMDLMREALAISPDHPEMRKQLEEISARIEQVAKLVQTSVEFLNRGDLDQALATARKASELFPGHAEAQELSFEITRQIRQRKTAAAIGEAVDWIGKENALAARASLELAMSIGGLSHDIEQLSRQIDDLEIRLEIDRMLTDARVALDLGELERSDAVLTKIDNRFDARLTAKQSDSMRSLRSEIAESRKQIRINQLLAIANKQLAEGQFTIADGSVRRALELSANNAVALQLLAELSARIRERELSLHLESVAELLSAGDLEAADQRLATVSAEFQDRSEVLALRERMDRLTKERTIRRIVAGANARLASSELDEALTLAREAVALSPADSHVSELLTRIETAIEERRLAKEAATSATAPEHETPQKSQSPAEPTSIIAVVAISSPPSEPVISEIVSTTPPTPFEPAQTVAIVPAAPKIIVDSASHPPTTEACSADSPTIEIAPTTNVAEVSTTTIPPSPIATPAATLVDSRRADSKPPPLLSIEEPTTTQSASRPPPKRSWIDFFSWIFRR